MIVNMKYDVIIIGAGPGGIFSAYELMKKSPEISNTFTSSILV